MQVCVNPPPNKKNPKTKKKQKRKKQVGGLVAMNRVDKQIQIQNSNLEWEKCTNKGLYAPGRHIVLFWPQYLLKMASWEIYKACDWFNSHKLT